VPQTIFDQPREAGACCGLQDLGSVNLTLLHESKYERRMKSCEARLQVGHWADVTVFDAEQIESRFTPEQPRAYPGGIVHVMVNGALAVQDGLRTERNAGSRALPELRW
jgi:hypothetical protein